MSPDLKPFTAPATYPEARAMLGQTFIMPNGQPGRISGCGMSGEIASIAFVAPGSGGHDWIAHWTGDHGFETAADRKARVWDESSAKLSKTARDLVETVFPGTFNRADRAALKNPSRLANVAKARLHKDGKLAYENCGRCGGSGRYSYNQIDGDRCFGCNGKGIVFPSDSTALKAARRAICCADA